MSNIFGPSPLDAIRAVTFAIRSDRTGTEGFLNQVRQAVWSVNASLPVASMRTMQDIYDRSMARTSFTLVMLGIAGAMALMLGIIGIYGVIAYAVSQRRREIGIRLALGAPPSELRRMFMRYALTLAGIGVAIGLVAAPQPDAADEVPCCSASRPLDLVTYAAVPLVLAAGRVLGQLPAGSPGGRGGPGGNAEGGVTKRRAVILRPRRCARALCFRIVAFTQPEQSAFLPFDTGSTQQPVPYEGLLASHKYIYNGRGSLSRGSPSAMP